MSEMDVAKMMFGWANDSASMLGMSSSASSSSASNVRYGTVIEVNEDGTYQVQLDTGEVITMESETPLEVGDRVSLINQDGSYVLYSMTTFVAQSASRHQQVLNEIVAEGEKIKLSVEDDIAEVEASFTDFKATHTMTDEDITTSIESSSNGTIKTIEGKIEDLDETYVKTATFTDTLDEFSREFSDTYVNKTDAGDMEVRLDSAIKANSEAISLEVSERIEAVNGAVKTAEAYTNYTADGIKDTVKKEITDEFGNTYVTTTTMETTAEGVKTVLRKEIETAQATADDAQDSADSAYNEANANKKFIDTYFEETSEGFVVGSSESSYRSRVAPGSFDIINADGAEVASIEYSNGDTTFAGRFISGDPQTLTLRAFPSSFGMFVISDNSLEWNATYGSAIKRRGSSYSGGAVYYAGETLYENESGTSSSLTGENSLPYSLKYFKAIDIVYMDDGSTPRYGVRRVYDPDGKSVVIERIVHDGDTKVYTATTLLVLSGKTVSFSKGGQFTVSGTTVSTVATNKLKIVKIIGWSA